MRTIRTARLVVLGLLTALTLSLANAANASTKTALTVEATTFLGRSYTYVNLGFLAEPEGAEGTSRGRDINSAGQVAGGSSTEQFGANRAVWWQDGQLLDLGVLVAAGSPAAPPTASTAPATSWAAPTSARPSRPTPP